MTYRFGRAHRTDRVHLQVVSGVAAAPGRLVAKGNSPCELAGVGRKAHCSSKLRVLCFNHLDPSRQWTIDPRVSLSAILSPAGRLNGADFNFELAVAPAPSPTPTALSLAASLSATPAARADMEGRSTGTGCRLPASSSLYRGTSRHAARGAARGWERVRSHAVALACRWHGQSLGRDAPS